MAGDGSGLKRAVREVASRAVTGLFTGGASLAAEFKLLLIQAAVVAAIIIGFTVALLVFLVVLGAPAAADRTPGGMTCTSSASLEQDIKGARQDPERLMTLYQSAAAEKDNKRQEPLGERGVWILAAINRVETNFGTNMGPSSAGAIGWMQFLPSTWRQIGVDTDGDGTPDRPYGHDYNGDGEADPYDPEDAIPAAGAYLRRAGAPRDWTKAIYAYNHSTSYVNNVQTTADRYQGLCTEGGGTGPAPGEGAEAAVRWALSQVGTMEQPRNSNCGPKIRDWQRNAGAGCGTQWCGVFVHEAFLQAGTDLNNLVISTSAIKQMADEGKNGFASVPKEQTRRGDLVVFDWEGDGKPNHVGLATSDYDGSGRFRTVEGNTGAGGVYARNRPLAEVIVVARVTAS